MAVLPGEAAKEEAMMKREKEDSAAGVGEGGEKARVRCGERREGESGEADPSNQRRKGREE